MKASGITYAYASSGGGGCSGDSSGSKNTSDSGNDRLQEEVAPATKIEQRGQAAAI